MDRPKVRKLLVEGEEDKRVIPELVEKATGLPWGERPRPTLVDIKAADGIERMLARDYIETELKMAGLHSLGLILDADDKPAARWQTLRNRCLPFCPDFPAEPPPEGLVTLLSSRVRFGAWLMPDNQQRGMLETFLATLRPTDTQPALWQHVTSAVDASRQHGALWLEPHRDKALCHTFLALQDPPGRQLHQALKERVLDAKSPAAQPFVAWFCRLYELTPQDPPSQNE